MKNIDVTKKNIEVSNKSIGLQKVSIGFPLLFVPSFVNVEKSVDCVTFSIDGEHKTIYGEKGKFDDGTLMMNCNFDALDEFKG